MQIKNIKNKTTKDLIEQSHNRFMTIKSDLEDSINNIENEEELTRKLQSVLEVLKNEIEYYCIKLELINGCSIRSHSVRHQEHASGAITESLLCGQYDEYTNK